MNGRNFNLYQVSNVIKFKSHPLLINDQTMLVSLFNIGQFMIQLQIAYLFGLYLSDQWEVSELVEFDLFPTSERLQTLVLRESHLYDVLIIKTQAIHSPFYPFSSGGSSQ